jgi:hypothetical protein
MIRLRRVSQVMVAIVALSLAAPAFASLSQGFATSSSIPPGSLVALDQTSTGSVVAADPLNVNRLFGVVVPPSSASISLSGTGSGQVQVVTTGTANVLVSTAGGSIKVGDYITVSPISGVGEKAGADSARVVGTAQTNFNGTGSGITQDTIGSGTSKQQVEIGEIPVEISVSTYTSTDGKQTYVVPTWLQNLSNTLAGKSVSPIRIIIATLILIVSLVSITVLLYSAVRNSIISIGRNPLSRSSVLRGLLQVILITGGILGLTAGAMYLVISR